VSDFRRRDLPLVLKELSDLFIERVCLLVFGLFGDLG
jgi:hypothetical protein